MSVEQSINQVRHTLSTVEALLVQAEETLKGCQQTQQTRLELAKAQIEYRLVKNATETLMNTSKTTEMTVKQHQNYIKTLNRRLSTLQEDIAALIRQKVSMHRGLRALGPMWGNRRQIGLPRQRGRILGVPAGAPAIPRWSCSGAPLYNCYEDPAGVYTSLAACEECCVPPGGECACACGLTNYEIKAETPIYYNLNLCRRTYNNNTIVASCTLNLANPACVVVMAAILYNETVPRPFGIERPFGSDVTDQNNSVLIGRISVCGDSIPFHNLEACESLPAGAYTWSLVNRSGININVLGSWIKAREITCLPV